VISPAGLHCYPGKKPHKPVLSRTQPWAAAKGESSSVSLESRLALLLQNSGCPADDLDSFVLKAKSYKEN